MAESEPADPPDAVALAGMAGVVAWAGFPVHGPDGRVAGALCVADHLPRNWSGRDIEILQTLAQVAGREVALQAALRHGAERAALAQTLQESLLPPRVQGIPGLQVAARYAAGGTAVEGSRGLLRRLPLGAGKLGDGGGRRVRFLTAIYATIRPTLAGASVRISSGGHPLALVRRAGGRVHAAGRPGTLLGLLARPELHDGGTVSDDTVLLVLTVPPGRAGRQGAGAPGSRPATMAGDRRQDPAPEAAASRQRINAYLRPRQAGQVLCG